MSEQFITEKRILEFSPVALTSDGTVDGKITVDKACRFRVGQIVRLYSDTQQPIFLQIKRILSATNSIYLGLKDKPIQDRTNVSAYTVADNAKIDSNEQNRPIIPQQEIERITYEEEPVMARRSFLVDKCGRHYTLDNPFPVVLSDGSINIGTVNAELEVQLSHKDNDPDVGDVHDSVRIGDGVETLAINPDGSINVVLTTSGNPVNYRQFGQFTDTTETTVATYTTSQNNVKIVQFMGESQTYGTWRIYEGAVTANNLIAVTRTSPTDRNGNIHFVGNHLVVTSGTNINVTFQADRYRSTFLPANSKTFVRLDVTW